MNDYEEDFGDFPSEYKEESKESLIEHMAQSRHFNIQQEMGSQKKMPSLFDGSTSWFKYEELIEDWLDLTVLEDTKWGPALKNRLVGDAEMYKGLLDRESLRATDREGSSACVPLEIRSVQTSKKRKFRNCQVDRQVCTVFEALKRRLHGQLADVLHERTTKTKSVSCPT